MRVAAIQSNYIPWKGYFDIIHDADIFVFYDEVSYTKNDWRNRNKIYSKNGLQWLTIPISADAVKLKISEVSPKDNLWQAKHHKALALSYGGAPYFHQLKPLIDRAYLDKTWNRLVDVNRFFIKEICSQLKIPTPFLDMADFDLSDGKVERLVSLLGQLGTTEYVSGPRGKEYLSPHQKLFRQSGIDLQFKDYLGYPEYSQLSAPFVHEVSLLDLFANVHLEEIPYHIWGWRTQEKRIAG